MGEIAGMGAARLGVNVDGQLLKAAANRAVHLSSMAKDITQQGIGQVVEFYDKKQLEKYQKRDHGDRVIFSTK